MSSHLTTLGLRASTLPSTQTPTYAPAYLTFHFLFAYAVLAPRHLKQIHGIEKNNVSPREDLSKHGEAAMRAGKISPGTLAMMRRNESAQANAVENYVLFVGAMGMATIAGVERESVNLGGLVYTLARVVYSGFYVFVEDPVWSYGRSVAWWVGNGSCLWLLWKAGGVLNSGS